MLRPTWLTADPPRRPGGGADRPGRDRRAVCWPAPVGRRRVAPPGTRVAVVGGGVAGVAAALALAERGVAVEVFERAGDLGGRVSGWPIQLADGTPATMSRGFHAFFRQYYNLRALLRRADPDLGMLTPLADYPLRHADGGRESFRRVPRTPPWNLLGFAALSPSFTLSGLRRLRPRAALPLLDVRTPDVYAELDEVSAAAFLDGVGFPPQARRLAFEVFARSFFADPARLSAAELALMFHIYFLGSAEGLLFDVPAEPYPSALWAPLARVLARHGASVRTRTRVTGVDRVGERFTVRADGLTPERYDGVVLALDTRGLAELVAASPDLGDAAWRASVAALPVAPPFLVSRCWLDRPVAPHRPGFLGVSGHSVLDNVSVLDRWEGEAARWAGRAGGSVVELHAYAVPADADRREVERRAYQELARVWPETAQARLVDVRHLWAQDCPLFPVGGYRDRPAVRTPTPGLALAGDLVRTDLPTALMERAATTGFEAANALLARWDVTGHPLWSVPVHGRSAPLRALARAATPR